jgi:hypothetical protein
MAVIVRFFNTLRDSYLGPITDSYLCKKDIYLCSSCR